MKRTKEDYPSFNLFSIVGTWESINLNPTVIIYRNDNDYLLSIIYMSENTKQASPLLMRYSKMMVASILLPLHLNGSVWIMIREKMYLTFHHWVTICATNQVSSNLEINISIKQSFNHGTNK